MTNIQTRYIASFIGAHGKRLYVGEGATMPFNKDEARLFEDKDKARLAAALIGVHHKALVPNVLVEKWKGVIAKPAVMTMLGL